MKIIFFGTVDLGQGYPRSRALLQSLELLGGEVEVITALPGERRLHQACRGIWGKAKLAARWFKARRSLAHRAQNCAPPDLVVVGYPAHTVAGLARRLWPQAVIAHDMMLSLHDTVAGDRGMMRPGSIAGRLLAQWDRWTVNKADLVITDTEEMGDYLSRLTGRERGAFMALPCGDPDAPEPGDFYRYRPPGPGEKLRVLFFGTGVPLHGLATILAAANRSQLAEVTVVGGGDELDNHATLKVKHINNWVDREELQDLMHNCHLSLGIFGKGDKAARVLPLKVYNALAEGVPVLTGDSPAARRLLTPEKEVFLIPRGDSVALADKLDELARFPDQLEAVANAGQRAFQERFSVTALSRLLGLRLQGFGLDPNVPMPVQEGGLVLEGANQ